MSFSFYAAGDREPVTAQLKAACGDDSLKVAIVGLLAEHVGKSELHGYRAGDTEFREQYVIEASGHSGPQSTLSLHVKVTSMYVPVVETTVDEPRRGTRRGTHRRGRPPGRAVLAVIDKCISDLGFAASETHADRLAQMREHVKGTFDTVVDATIDDDED